MPKFKLSQTYLYGGRHYGPGEVDIQDADVAKALQERDASVLAARKPRMTEGRVDAAGAVVGAEPVAEPKDGGESARRASTTTRRA
jgi:hypothetical protein